MQQQNILPRVDRLLLLCRLDTVEIVVWPSSWLELRLAPVPPTRWGNSLLNDLLLCTSLLSWVLRDRREGGGRGEWGDLERGQSMSESLTNTSVIFAGARLTSGSGNVLSEQHILAVQFQMIILGLTLYGITQKVWTSFNIYSCENGS